MAPLRLSQWRKVPVEERRKGGEGQEPGGSPETIPVEEGLAQVGVVAPMQGWQ